MNAMFEIQEDEFLLFWITIFALYAFLSQQAAVGPVGVVLREEEWVEDEVEAVEVAICHWFRRRFGSLRVLTKVSVMIYLTFAVLICFFHRTKNTVLLIHLRGCRFYNFSSISVEGQVSPEPGLKASLLWVSYSSELVIRRSSTPIGRSRISFRVPPSHNWQDASL